ncbi:Acyl-coenzyme A thioesterase THEM5 [Plecturocebus cupreus]
MGSAACSPACPRGSLVVMDMDVETIEDQKLCMSCIAQSRDQKTVYAKSSGVFLQLQLEASSSSQDSRCACRRTSHCSCCRLGPTTEQGAVLQKRRRGQGRALSSELIKSPSPILGPGPFYGGNQNLPRASHTPTCPFSTN